MTTPCKKNQYGAAQKKRRGRGGGRVFLSPGTGVAPRAPRGQGWSLEFATENILYPAMNFK